MKIIAISGGGRAISVNYLPIAELFGALKSFDKPFNDKEFLEAVKEL